MIVPQWNWSIGFYFILYFFFLLLSSVLSSFFIKQQMISTPLSIVVSMSDDYDELLNVNNLSIMKTSRFLCTLNIAASLYFTFFYFFLFFFIIMSFAFTRNVSCLWRRNKRIIKCISFIGLIFSVSFPLVQCNGKRRGKKCC